MAKVTVNLPDDQVGFLQSLAKEEGITFTEALRRSIKSEKFLHENEQLGHKFLIEDVKNNRLREVIRK